MQDFALFGKRNESDRLKFLHAEGRMPHAIMLTGAKGLGKKLLARWCTLLMMCEKEDAPCMCCRNCHNILNEEHPDVIYAKGEKYSADSIRDILHKSSLYPNDGELRVVIFDDCDEMTEVQQNLLLKAIEEPSKYNRYIFTCENPDSMLSTILSRVVTIPVPEMTSEECKSCLALKDVPDEEADEYIKKLGTNPGKILSAIADKKQIELYDSAERAAQYIADGNEYLTAREFARYTDREELFTILSIVYEKVCKAVRPEENDDKTVTALKENLSFKKLYALSVKIEELTALSDFNVNARVFAAYCSSQIFEVIA